MGENKRWGAGLLSVVCLALLIQPVAAAGIKRFTDKQGVVHITNLAETAPELEETQPVLPRTFLGPENKLDKMRILGILPPEENLAQPPTPSETEAKNLHSNEENR
jgi:hypothetical protein